MPRGTIQSALRPSRGTTTLAEVMKIALRAAKVSIRTTIPCTVDTYDPATKKATVIAGHVMVLKTDAGERELEPMKVVGCPVRWPGTSAGRMTFTLAKGDTGHLIISDRSLEQWMNKPPVLDAVDPSARQTHNIIDGIFEPGLMTTADAAAVLPTDATGAMLEGAPFIKLGELAAQPFFAARVTDTVSSTAALTTWALAVEAALAAASSPIAPASTWATLGLGTAVPPGPGATATGTISSGSVKTIIE